MLGGGEGEIEGEGSWLPVGESSDIPSASLATGYDDIFAGFPLEHARVIPCDRYLGDEGETLWIALILGWSVAEHIEGREEDNVLRELTAARALTHRMGVVLVKLGLGDVAHGALGIVDGTCYLADEGDVALVGDQVIAFAKLGDLKPHYGFIVEHIGHSHLKPCRWEDAVEVNEGMIPSAHLGGLTAEAYDLLVGTRSEERRVGKECRSRWSPYH